MSKEEEVFKTMWIADSNSLTTRAINVCHWILSPSIFSGLDNFESSDASAYLHNAQNKISEMEDQLYAATIVITGRKSKCIPEVKFRNFRKSPREVHDMTREYTLPSPRLRLVTHASISIHHSFLWKDDQ